MRRFSFVPVLVLLALQPGRAAAQSATMKVDTLVQIAAIVGDSMITNAEVEQALDLWAQQSNQPRPDPGPELDRLVNEILNERINGLLIIQAALRDTTIVVTDDEIRTAVDRQIESVAQQNGGRTNFERLLQQSNFTMEAYREYWSVQIREDRLRRQYLQRVFQKQKPPPVSDQEIRTVWDREVASGAPPTLPPSISFNQIVIPVTPSDSALARARAKADSIRNLIVVDKEEFAQVARRFGEDGTRELGGDLGWFRPGSMVAEFERAAYSLAKPGDISQPILTQYGYHIIKLERVRGPERQARHILIRPGVTEADKQRARTLAEQMMDRVRNGESIDSLQRQYGDPDEPAHVPLTPRDSMPEGYRTAVASASPGDLVGPIEVAEAPPAPPKWVVVRVDRIEDAREATVADYRAQIQQSLAQQKLMDEIVAELRRNTYIEIRASPTSGQR